MLIDEEHSPRIGDFGLSSTIGKLQPGLSYLQRSSSNVGAVRWAAPERLSGCKPHASGDIYSFGCMMFEVTSHPGVSVITEFSPQVLSGEIPWKEKNNYQVVALKLEAHKPPSRPIHTSVEDEHWALMVRCWSTCVRRRPTAREVVVVVRTFLSTDTHRGTHDTGRQGCGTFEIWIFFFSYQFPD